jgi:hypothetical protein
MLSVVKLNVQASLFYLRIFDEEKTFFNNVETGWFNECRQTKLVERKKIDEFNF